MLTEIGQRKPAPLWCTYPFGGCTILVHLPAPLWCTRSIYSISLIIDM